MRIWVYLHTHRFGQDIYLVKAETQPTDEAVIKVHEIDFEEGGEDESFECAYALYKAEIPIL